MNLPSPAYAEPADTRAKATLGHHRDVQGKSFEMGEEEQINPITYGFYGNTPEKYPFA